MTMQIVYGGSFNPPTLAHRRVVDFLDRALEPEKFSIVPVGNVYGKKDLAPDQHRLEMLKVAFRDKRHVIISDVELFDREYKGTFETLKRLEDEPPIAFVIGADHLLGLHRWKHIHKMLHQYRFIVLNRNQQSLKHIIERDAFLRYYRSRFILFESFEADESASSFRRTRDPALLDEKVYDYIEANQLYKG